MTHSLKPSPSYKYVSYIIQLRENVETDGDEVQAFYYNREKENKFKGGVQGTLKASHIIMAVPESELTITRPAAAKVSCYPKILERNSK